MIIKISRGSHVKGVVEYNEKKVSEGMAELISNNTLEKSTGGKVAHFIETFELNEKVNKNKYAHFSFSLSPGESLDNLKFKSLADEYLQKMGYTDTPVLMYKHFDGATEHIHAVVSSVKYDGVKVSEWKDRPRSMEISRGLEKTYGLKVMAFTDNQSIELSEVNAEKYTLCSAIKKSVKSGNNTIVNTEGLKNKFSNEDFIQKYGKEKFDQILGDLDRRGMVYKTDKMILIEKLEYLYSTSRDKKEFITKVENNGMYIREIGSQGKPKLTYGIGKRYFEEKKLPLKFQQENLLNHFGKKELLGLSKQKDKIRFQVNQILTKSKDLEEFKQLLSYRGIEVKEASNSGGVYGLSFKYLDADNSEFIKASDVDRKLSFNVIKSKLAETAEKESKKGSASKETKERTAAAKKSAGGKAPSKLLGHTDANNAKPKKKGKDKDDKFENDVNI